MNGIPPTGSVKDHLVHNLSGKNMEIFHNNKISTTAPGGRLNKKDGLTRYGNSHVKDKTS